MTLKSDEQLDENQQKARDHLEGPALVVAGPGSGKTRVIKARILHLIQKRNVDPEHILAIAFTNAAVDELEERISEELDSNHGRPKICTLHVFGKDLVTNHYDLLGFSKDPDIWDADDIGQIIYQEKYRLQRATDTTSVAIYKFEGMTTGRCYIGQTTNPERREQEHRTYSSNRGLRTALRINDERFEFKVIATVMGQNADEKETQEIRLHRNRAAVNLDQNTKKPENSKTHIPVSVYKIKSATTATCWIGQSENPEQSIEDHYNNSSDDDLRNAIENGKFEIITDKLPRDKATRRVLEEIEVHKNWAVFNREDPLQAAESNKRRIEVFCEHFNVSYDEVLKHTTEFRYLMNRFNTLRDDIEKVKRQVSTGLFEPNKIGDPVFRAFAKRYEQRKEEADAIDFLDMLILSANMLEEYPELLNEYRDTYRYVFVDEFQDISPVDFRLIDLFSENLFAVGDDDQAIYGFRGGDSQIMQDKFGKQEDVSHYEITRNYRSTSSVVKHARALILYNNPHRFSKNLQTENSARSRVAWRKTSLNTIESVLLSEFLPVVTACETHFKENMPYLGNLLLQELTIPQKIGILARNRSEVKKIQQILRGSKLLTQGFKVSWSEADDPEKRKMFLQRGTAKIEVSTIHSAKGREWEKVILIVNTLDVWGNGNPYISLPDTRNEITEERRVFYVAVTRAEQELVVLGGNCQFISEFQNVRPIETLEAIESKIQKELAEIFQKAQETLKLRLKQKLEGEITAVLTQSDELNRLRGNIANAERASEQMEIELPQQLESINNALLEDLIPVLDTFESQTKKLPATAESNNESDDFVSLRENVQRVQTQLLNLAKDHELKPIEASPGALFNPVYHGELSPAIYFKGVPEGKIAREEQRGYLLHDQVIRKACVVISKRKQRADELLCQDFAQPVRFVTYAGFRDLRNIETFRGEVKGYDSQGEAAQLKNLNVLFAFPKDDMVSLKSHIKKIRNIASQNLQPIELISDQLHIEPDILKQLVIKPDVIEFDYQDPTIELITRSGHLLKGHLRGFDDEFLYITVNKKDVIVYRAGILKFRNLVWNEITKAYKNKTTIRGHIIGRGKSGLKVKFKLLTGFLPATQIELKTVRNLDRYVGKTLKMKVTKISKAHNNIIFSRRAWFEEKMTKLLNSFSDVSEKPPQLRNIKRMSKTAELTLETNLSPLFPEVERVLLDKSTNVTVPELVHEMIDTSLPVSADLTENLETYAKNLTPELHKPVEVQHDPLYEPIDLIVPEPVKKMVESRLPTSKNSSRIPDPQTQDLTPELPLIERDPDILETVNSNADSTLPEHDDILREQVQNLRPDTFEPDIVSDPPIAVGNRTQEPQQEHEAILQEQIQNLRPDTPEPENPDKAQDSSENKVEDEKKSFGDYLSQGGHFVVEKIKVIIFKKPSS